MPSRILVSWIGNTDLRAMADSLPPSKSKSVLEVAGDKPPVEGVGPLKTLIDHQKFQQIHLLSNYDETIALAYVDWIDQNAKLHTVELDIHPITENS